MRQNAGTATGLLALLALLFHAVYQGSEGEPAQDKGKDKKSESQKNNDSDDAAPEGPWLATRAFFHTPGSVPKKQQELTKQIGEINSPALPQPAAGLKRLLGAPNDLEAYSIIATVADPAHTRLALFFDGQVEAIERAAEVQGWEFAYQWLPWLDPFDASESDIAERRKQRGLEREQETYPGVLVFRRSFEREWTVHPEALFVFLVPETPTGGIAGDSFFAAMNLAKALKPMDQIRMLGPSFSGSFESLARIVKLWRDDHPNSDDFYHIAYSGTASGKKYADAFTRLTGLLQNGKTDQSQEITVSGGTATTSDYMCTFAHVIDQYHESGHAAILVEDESGFSSTVTEEKNSGKDKSCPQQEFHYYYFPRDIAHLRNAYQEAVGGTRARAKDVLPTLDFSLKDSARGEDSIPVFSDTQTPLAQSAVVAAITNDFKSKRIRLVFILATNSLDTLFLANYIRTGYPDARVIVAEADILFVPAAAQESLTGTLFLSTYPMFVEGNEWLTNQGELSPESHLVLSQSDMQGLFNVTRLLLRKIKPPSDQEKDVDLLGYRRFEAGSTEEQHPGLWLLSLTRSGFLPVDWYKGEQEGWFEKNPVRSTLRVGDLEAKFPLPEPSLGWYVTSLGVSFSIFAVCWMFVRCNPVKGPGCRPYWLALTDDREMRWPPLLGAGLSLFLFEWILVAPVGPLFFYGSRVVKATTATVLLALLALVGCAIMAKRCQGRGKPFKHPNYSWTLISIISLACTGIALTWGLLCYYPFGGRTTTALLFRFRSLQLYSGVSPALPLVLLSAIFFLGFVLYFYRYTEAGMGKPRLQLRNLTTVPSASAYYRALENAIGSPMRLSLADLIYRLVASASGVGLCTLVLWSHLTAFELQGYKCLLVSAFIILLFALTSACYDIWVVWRNLKRLLALVELFPLQPAFKRVSKPWPRTPVWAFWKSVSRQALAAQMIRALHDLNFHASEDSMTKDDLERFRGAASERFGAEPKSARGRLISYCEYEYASARIASQMLTERLRPLWRGSSSESLDDSEPTNDLPTLASRNRADFVALQFCNYFLYAAKQAQRIAWSISLGLLMLIVALNSYPVQAPLLVGRFVAVLFVAIGAVIVWVFAGMERNTILSIISRTKPGELTSDFWTQLIAMGILPLIGVMAHLFPALGNFLSSWIAPSVEALH
jgi:hypothetical protein